MAHTATLKEERALLGEEVSVSQETIGDELPFIELKVTYLGGHTKKVVRLKGQLILDPDDPKNGQKKQTGTGFTNWDFSIEDERGRKIKSDFIWKDGQYAGKRFAFVSHFGQLAEFYKMRGPERERLFDIKGPRASIAVFEEYLRRVKKRVNPDQGAAVLKQMGMEND